MIGAAIGMAIGSFVVLIAEKDEITLIPIYGILSAIFFMLIAIYLKGQ